MINELIQNRYPKEVKLIDGTMVSFRPLKPEDRDVLLTFFQAIPEDDRLFLKEDVSKSEVVDSFCDNINFESVFPLLAEHNSKIIGDATLHTMSRTWMRHIARIRVAINPEYRHRGLATQMVKELIDLAKKTDIEKLDAEFMGEQESAIKVFQSLGFKEIAKIENHVIDILGKPHDLVILGLDLK